MMHIHFMKIKTIRVTLSIDTISEDEMFLICSRKPKGIPEQVVLAMFIW